MFGLLFFDLALLMWLCWWCLKGLVIFLVFDVAAVGAVFGAASL